MCAHEALRSAVVSALRDIQDPEMGRDIVDLGLVYGIEIADDRSIKIVMTTTTRFCPVADYIADAVRTRIEAIEGVSHALVDLTYEPRWSPEMIGRAVI